MPPSLTSPMANEERRMGPRKLAPKLPANSSSTSSGYAYDSNTQSQSQSQEPQPNVVPTKPKRAQVRAACVACQRGKAKVRQAVVDADAYVNFATQTGPNMMSIVRWCETVL